MEFLWIGANDKKHEGQFVWEADNSRVGPFSKWMEQKKLIPEVDDCVSLYKRTTNYGTPDSETKIVWKKMECSTWLPFWCEVGSKGHGTTVKTTPRTLTTISKKKERIKSTKSTTKGGNGKGKTGDGKGTTDKEDKKVDKTDKKDDKKDKKDDKTDKQDDKKDKKDDKTEEDGKTDKNEDKTDKEGGKTDETTTVSADKDVAGTIVAVWVV